jgi:hypothetical protein
LAGGLALLRDGRPRTGLTSEGDRPGRAGCAAGVGNGTAWPVAFSRMKPLHDKALFHVVSVKSQTQVKKPNCDIVISVPKQVFTRCRSIWASFSREIRFFRRFTPIENQGREALFDAT